MTSALQTTISKFKSEITLFRKEGYLRGHVSRRCRPVTPRYISESDKQGQGAVSVLIDMSDF